jgi:hypothetical protein
MNKILIKIIYNGKKINKKKFFFSHFIKKRLCKNLFESNNNFFLL